MAAFSALKGDRPLAISSAFTKSSHSNISGRMV